MLGIGSGFFLQLPNESGHLVLHPAKVIGLEDHIYTADLEANDLIVAVGRDLLIFHEQDREFMQQAAVIRKIPQDDLESVFGFETPGEPCSAENREHYRVSAINSGLTAGFGAERDCPLLDISCTGFSVSASMSYDIGSIVDAGLTHEGKEYSGKVLVQSIRELSKRRRRYGVHCVEIGSSASGMLKGLQEMSMSLQGEQLRRFAGAT